MPITDSPKPPPRRLTLTLPALRDAAAVIVVATGAAKADAIREIRNDAGSKLPAALALRSARRGRLIVDHAAAG
jgi:6-phosphogluconolactonase